MAPARLSASSGAAAMPERTATAPGPSLIEAWGPAILAIFFVSLMIPGNFQMAGFSLSPYRVVLILAFIPLALHWIRGRAGPIGPGDIAILLYCLWIWIALFANHGLGRVHTAGIQFAEMFGGYLMGRTLIRSGEDFARFVRYLLYALLFLLPFALLEFLTGSSPLRTISQMFLNVDERRLNRLPRLGFQDRVQGPFPHSILFGLFCSLAVANLFYHFRRGIVRRFGAAGLAIFLVLTSLSSAPLISAGLQIGMILWDRILAILRLRWVILAVIAATVLGGFQLLYPGGIIAFVIENLIFVPITGYARIEIFEFGILSVYNNPVFGIGFNDWARAFWMGHPTIDNYWLVVAVHYGIPGLLLLWAGIGLNILRAMTNPDLEGHEAAQRTGYLVALVGLVMVLGTVAIWGSVSTFVLTYLGAGAWFGERRQAAPAGRGGRRARPSGRAGGGTGAGGPASSRAQDLPGRTAAGSRSIIGPEAGGRPARTGPSRRPTAEARLAAARARRPQ
jgi:hypothetical protein